MKLSGETQGRPGVTQGWPRVTQGWLRVTQGWPRAPRGDPGATWQQWFLGFKMGATQGWCGGNPGTDHPGLPQVAPGSPLGCLQVALGRFRVTLEPNNKVVLCNKLFFFAWLFAFLGFNKSVCEINYPSVICNNTFDYIRRYGRSAGFSRWYLRYHKLKKWIFSRHDPRPSFFSAKFFWSTDLMQKMIFWGKEIRNKKLP